MAAGVALIALALAAGCAPVAVGIGAGATAGVVIAQERSAGDAVKDSRINLEISEALFQAHVDDLFRPVNVDVVEGRVLLTGMVKTQELADRAAAIAWRADGVRQVLNEVRVGDSAAVDAARDRWLTTKLRGRLLTDSQVFDVNYTITTVGGTIYLIGIAQDQAELDRVLAHARTLEQVRRVVSHVVMKDDPSRT